MNWKNESTWAAIGSGLVMVLSAIGFLSAEEGVLATSSLASIATGVIGVLTLAKSVSNRRKAEAEAAKSQDAEK